MVAVCVYFMVIMFLMVWFTFLFYFCVLICFVFFVFFFFSSRRRHTRFLPVSWVGDVYKRQTEASPEYVFVTISAAMVPEVKSQPKRALICILGVLLGGMLSVAFVLIRYYGFSKESN